MTDGREPSETPEAAGETPPALSTRSYNAVVASAHLLDVLMVESSFKVEPSYFDDETEKNFACKLAQVKVDVDSERGAAQGTFTWTAHVVKSSNDIILRITSKFVVMYANLAGQDPKATQAFVRRVGTFTSYPYFRSYVSHLSSLSRAELPTLPVLRESRSESRAPSQEEASATDASSPNAE